MELRFISQRRKGAAVAVLYILPTYRQVPHPFRDRWPLACLLRTTGFAPGIGISSSGMLVSLTTEGHLDSVDSVAER